jgi:hypothetical protein
MSPNQGRYELGFADTLGPIAPRNNRYPYALLPLAIATGRIVGDSEKAAFPPEVPISPLGDADVRSRGKLPPNARPQKWGQKAPQVSFWEVDPRASYRIREFG